MQTMLNVKTHYSLLQSLITVDDLVLFAKNKKIKTLSIVDNSLFGIMEFVTKCNEENIKPIFGYQIKLNDFDIVLFPKNYDGYLDLLKINSLINENELNNENFSLYKNNLIIVSLSVEYKINHDDLYYGFSNQEELLIINKRRLKAVFFREVYYLEETDYLFYNYLNIMNQNETISNHHLNNNNYHYLNESIVFSDKNSLYNVDKIISDINIVFPKSKISLPKYDVNIKNSDEYLYLLSKKGLEKRFDNNVQDKYTERLELELKTIIKMGYADYFLIVYDFILYAKKKNILVGPGRGSAAGSLVAYSLGITDVDPLQYQLLFERFLNPERVSMPDIDTDFPDIYREEIIDYVINKYGNNNVSRIVTFGVFGSKNAIREFGKVLNIPDYKINNILKYFSYKEKSLKNLYEDNNNFRVMINEDIKLKELYEVSLKFENIIRHHSKHAAGVVMSDKTLDEIIPLIKVNDQYLSAYTMNYLEALGLLKMDFLGVKNLTMIMDIINDINDGGHFVNFNNIPLDDDKTFSLFKKGETNGIFQFESKGMKKLLKQLLPSNFLEVVVAIALYRPGAMKGIEDYVTYKNKNQIKPSKISHLLEDTFGIIIYQEQVMNILKEVANYSLGEADLVRRAIAKKKTNVLTNEHEKFIKKGLDNNYDLESLEEIYDQILLSMDYSFPKAHAVSYGLVSYKMTYLKANYPLYFYRNLLNNVIGSTYKTNEYIIEARKNNVVINKPNINLSKNDYEIINDELYYPLVNIKGLNHTIVEKVLHNINPVNDIFDLVKVLDKQFITKEILISFIYSGTLDNLIYNQKTMIENLDAIINYGELVHDLGTSVAKPVLVKHNEYSSFELSTFEKEIYGFYFNNHPVSLYRTNDEKDLYLVNLRKHFNKEISLYVLIDDMRVINTKKGDKMAFLTISDETSKEDAVLFPKMYLKYGDLTKGDLIKITGNVERREERFQIIINAVDKLG